MNINKTYISLLVSNIEVSKDWYTKLLGREPDNKPMDSLIQWEIFNHSGIGICTEKEIAHRGALFLYVDDLSQELQRLKKESIEFGKDIKGDYSTLVQILDPDGNLITLASSPNPPFPKYS